MQNDWIRRIVAIVPPASLVWGLIARLGLLTVVLAGCNRSEPAPNNGVVSAESAASSVQTQMADAGAPGDAALPQGNSGQSASFDPFRSAESPHLSPDTPMGESRAGKRPATDVARELPQLRPDLEPRELVAFLGDIDRDLGALINDRSRLRDQRVVKDEVIGMIGLKRVAAERLSQHPDAAERDQITGHRGVLQALSHLASMGDLKAAEELVQIARESRHSPNAALRSDSQLVLIGLEIESLRHGKPDAAAHVIALVHELLDANEEVDVATLMVLAQAKDALLLYDYQDEATEVRDLIVQRFGRAQNAEIARMAAMIAAAGFSQVNTPLERLDQLRQQFATAAAMDPENAAGSSDAGVNGDGGEKVEPAAWRSAMDEVLATPPDVLTVEFLCGASLEAEAVGRVDIADATYDVLQQQFADRQDAMGRVARTALRARENRQEVIGQKFDPDLPSVDGQALSMDDYRGKVVLMPFWSSAFTDSLIVLPNLLEIQKQNPDRVAVVGMNLDVAGTDVVGFLQREGLELPSFRSVSDPGAEIVNEVAYRFGAVTLLFVAVMDAEGRVVHLDFSGEDLTSVVQKHIR